MNRFILAIIVVLAWRFSMAMPALADGPVTVITATQEAEDGVIFTVPGGIPLYMMDDGGNAVFSRSVPGLDFKRQGDVLTYWDADSGTFKVLDKDYQEVDSWAAVGYPTDLHDLQLLPNGHALLLVYREFSYDLTPWGGYPTATVVSCVVQEIATDKSLAWEWDGWDHNPITDTIADLTLSRVDYDHCNAVEQDADGNVMVSHRQLSQVTKIDRETGAVIWKLGGASNEFTFTNDAGFAWQHDIRRLADGRITLFDNGLPARGHSRAVEFEIDEVSKVITRTWEFRGPFAFCCGNAQRLPGGNTFINWGPAHPTITEVTRDGRVVFAADTAFSYRSFRFAWWRRWWLPLIFK